MLKMNIFTLVQRIIVAILSLAGTSNCCFCRFFISDSLPTEKNCICQFFILKLAGRIQILFVWPAEC